MQAQSSGIIEAQFFTENANFEKFNQHRFNSKLLNPVARPHSALVNPIAAFETLKEPVQFKNMFHGLTSPKIRQDVIKLIQENEIFVKDAPKAMLLLETEIEKYVLYSDYRLLNCQNHINGSDFEVLIQANKNDGKKLLDELNKIKTEENIIKCDDILQSLEKTLNKIDNVRLLYVKISQKTFRKYRNIEKNCKYFNKYIVTSAQISFL